MLDAEQAGVFFAASVLLALAPGPDNLFVLNQSLRQGRDAGILVTLGLCTGLIFHTLLVILGVATFIGHQPDLFVLLKAIGASYLLYLAYQSIQAARQPMSAGKTAALSGAALYQKGVLLNISNPKVGLFFLAFLPQFVAPESDHTTGQFALLGGLFIIATMLVFGLIATVSGPLSRYLEHHPNAHRLLEWLCAATFFTLACRLILSETL